MISLPNNPYDGMVMINSLANSGQISELVYGVAEDNGEIVLKFIKGVIGPKLVVRKPSSRIVGGRHILKGPLSGNILVPSNGDGG